jgi:hypothetical protein
MIPGDAVAMTSCTAVVPGGRAGYKVPVRGDLFAFVYLGIKKKGELFDPVQALIELGWIPPVNIMKERISMETTSKLVEGNIPAKTPCPFKTECSLLPHCDHQGEQHTVAFSCASARAFDLVKRVSAA